MPPVTLGSGSRLASEGRGTGLDREGEAGVDVDVVEVLGRELRELEHACRGEGLAGMVVELLALGQAGAVAHLGRGAQVDALADRNTEACPPRSRSRGSAPRPDRPRCSRS